MTNDALSRQANKIDESRNRAEPFIKVLSGMELVILPRVFPGGTDTGLLCDTIKIEPREVVLDAFTGMGAVALKAALAGAAEVIGTDISPDAISNANKNKIKLGLTNIDFVEANVFPEPVKLFDVITANPPYTDNEAPDSTAAMFWDKDNMALKGLFGRLREFLAPSGRMYMTWPSFAPASLPEDLAKQHKCSIEIVSRRASGSSGFEYYVYLVKLQ